jgi:hypothetical protein
MELKQPIFAFNMGDFGRFGALATRPLRVPGPVSPKILQAIPTIFVNSAALSSGTNLKKTLIGNHLALFIRIIYFNFASITSYSKI